MKAIANDRFGGPEMLRYIDIEKPTPGDKQVLVKVAAAAVNPLDWHMLRGKPFMIRTSPDLRGHRPMRPGRDVAGTIEAVGREVTRFQPGDEVLGATQGAFADYVCGLEDAFVAKPDALSFEEAAAVPIGGLTALQALHDGGLKAGEKVLINGASGGVGTFAVQIAKALGAEVTGVCSAASVALVRELGADRAIDYRQEDFTRGSERFDLIVDLIGSHSYRRMKRVLTPSGRIVAAGGGGGGAYSLGRWLVRTLAAALASKVAGRKVILCMSRLSLEDLEYLKALIAAGRLRPVIDRIFPLSQTREAMLYLGAGHAHGKVVITTGA